MYVQANKYCNTVFECNYQILLHNTLQKRTQTEWVTPNKLRTKCHVSSKRNDYEQE